MRILALGLGGAGCRIVNSLYTTDRLSSKVACVQALAIDVHADTLSQLGSLPESAKLFFPPLDPGIHSEEEGDTQTATIDIGEIVARIQNIVSGETDAIFVCCGLGGSMVDIAPHVIAKLRATVAEPIFGLVTLPCLAEGERHSAKAADDIEMLSPLLDGVILFDNETWYKKTKAQRSSLVKKEKGLAEKLGFKKSEPEISPVIATYLLLNEAIVRRISLILRAGEFKADGGLDLAEIVLDSGEVLNTMKGMGYITIGYAVERLPHNPLSFLTNWRPTGFFADEHIKKASRIVDLAKQAIYHEISTPCDMTSAHKALVLIAGPSHELSLKGYMTVRKWIDRSIAGLETRSGDYPVMNTKNVAIIIMLSGLENIPRITELKEIQSQYKSSHQDRFTAIKQSDSGTIIMSEESGVRSGAVVTSTRRDEKNLKDEMLVLPVKAYKNDDPVKHAGESYSHQTEEIDTFGSEEPQRILPPQNRLPLKTEPDSTDSIKKTARVFTTRPHTAHEVSSQVQVNETGTLPVIASTPEPRHRVIVARENNNKTTQPAPGSSAQVSSVHGTSQNNKSSHDTDSRGSDEKHSPHSSDDRLRNKEAERQRIERELQRQRIMAISGRTPKTGSGVSAHPAHSAEIIRLKREISENKPYKDAGEPTTPVEIEHQVQEKRTVILQKKKVHPAMQEENIPADKNENAYVDNDDLSIITRPDVNSRQPGSEDLKIGIKNSAYKSKDTIFEGKGIHKMAAHQVRDSALMHTDLKSKKTHGESKAGESEPGSADQSTESTDSSGRRERKTQKKDDLSWI
jgi:cell division GTPase FtsZ